MRRWHRDGITAVVAFNDDAAADVVSASVRAGLRVPADLAVVGNDDAPIARMFMPAPSTVRLDVDDLGRRFAEFALYRVGDGPRPRWTGGITMTLVRRAST
ncbi:substrate-binding domain-containing protein [Frankia sp. AgB32]|uniref:substrate-binding domain-containing protein n=1 Tax=Frankia sp. AgB32 TaxID=631119 RepID=UPI0034D74DA3